MKVYACKLFISFQNRSKQLNIETWLINKQYWTKGLHFHIYRLQRQMWLPLFRGLFILYDLGQDKLRLEDKIPNKAWMLPDMVLRFRYRNICRIYKAADYTLTSPYTHRKTCFKGTTKTCGRDLLYQLGFTDIVHGCLCKFICLCLTQVL